MNTQQFNDALTTSPVYILTGWPKLPPGVLPPIICNLKGVGDGGTVKSMEFGILSAPDTQYFHWLNIHEEPHADAEGRLVVRVGEDFGLPFNGVLEPLTITASILAGYDVEGLRPGNPLDESLWLSECNVANYTQPMVADERDNGGVLNGVAQLRDANGIAVVGVDGMGGVTYLDSAPAMNPQPSSIWRDAERRGLSVAFKPESAYETVTVSWAPGLEVTAMGWWSAARDHLTAAVSIEIEAFKAPTLAGFNIPAAWAAAARAVQPVAVLVKSGGPFIGPRGGKWADPQHKIPWSPGGSSKGSTKGSADPHRLHQREKDPEAPGAWQKTYKLKDGGSVEVRYFPTPRDSDGSPKNPFEGEVHGVFRAIVEGRIVGWLNATKPPKSEHADRVAFDIETSPQHRRRGVGSAMLKAVNDHLGKKPIPSSHTLVDSDKQPTPDAQKLWASQDPAKPPKLTVSGVMRSFSIPGVGELHARVKDGALHIVDVEVKEGHRGQGHGSRLYTALARYAQTQNMELRSDATVEPGAVRSWEALGRRGFAVTKNPKAKEIEDDDEPGGLFVSGGNLQTPVYTLKPEPVGAPDLAKSEDADGSVSGCLLIPLPGDPPTVAEGVDEGAGAAGAAGAHVMVVHIKPQAPELIEAAGKAVAKVAAKWGPLRGRYGGIVETFEADGYDVHHHPVSDHNLVSFQTAVLKALKAVKGLDVSQTPKGYTPHHTIAYAESGAPEPEPMGVQDFEAPTVQWWSGDDTMLEIDLGGG